MNKFCISERAVKFIFPNNERVIIRGPGVMKIWLIWKSPEKIVVIWITRPRISR